MGFAIHREEFLDRVSLGLKNYLIKKSVLSGQFHVTLLLN